MIEVFVPTNENTSREDRETIVGIIQATPELGFVYRDLILEAIKNNVNRVDLVAARLDGELAGVAMIGSRRPYAYHFRTGDVAVVPRLRRHRVGSAMYLATAALAILEGRRTVEETVILDLSPWMIRSRESSGSCKGGPGFLVSLKYHPVGQYPEWTGGFKTIEPWIKPTVTEFHDWLDRVPEDTRIHLLYTAAAQKNLMICVSNYASHAPKLANDLVDLHQYLLTGQCPQIDVTPVGVAP